MTHGGGNQVNQHGLWPPKGELSQGSMAKVHREEVSNKSVVYRQYRIFCRRCVYTVEMGITCLKPKSIPANTRVFMQSSHPGGLQENTVFCMHTQTKGVVCMFKANSHFWISCLEHFFISLFSTSQAYFELDFHDSNFDAELWNGGCFNLKNGREEGGANLAAAAFGVFTLYICETHCVQRVFMYSVFWVCCSLWAERGCEEEAKNHSQPNPE